MGLNDRDTCTRVVNEDCFVLSTQSVVRCYSALQNSDVMVGGNFNAVFHMIRMVQSTP